MSENPQDLPDAPNGLGGESDVVAERSGADTPKAPRPIPADPAEARDEPDPAEARDEPGPPEGSGPPDGPPQPGDEEPADQNGRPEPGAAEEPDGNGNPAAGEPEVRPDTEPTG
ncbi:hypothetical protein [Nonomuraea cavernae]|uniref:hypothetical protein n=1 Tax=Nonomuraea cavernae TaxID=2045107 RepID=UPI0034047246